MTIAPYLAKPEPWIEHAACRGMPPDMFFPDEHSPRGKAWITKLRQAINVCERCPVKQECLDYAIEHKLDDGVFGGTWGRERQRMRGLMRGFRPT